MAVVLARAKGLSDRRLIPAKVRVRAELETSILPESIIAQVTVPRLFATSSYLKKLVISLSIC